MKEKYKAPMSEEEFSAYLEYSINLRTLDAVRRFRSIKRAFKRGLISKYGLIYPKRPFNNRANTSKRKGVHSRTLNEEKKRIYGKIVK